MHMDTSACYLPHEYERCETMLNSVEVIPLTYHQQDVRVLCPTVSRDLDNGLIMNSSELQNSYVHL